MGLIIDSGDRGVGALGGAVIRWRIATPAEREALAESMARGVAA